MKLFQLVKNNKTKSYIFLTILGFFLFNISTSCNYSKASSLKISDDFDYLPTSTTQAIVTHDYFVLSYNEKYEQAEWVAYILKKEQISNNRIKRPYFNQDKLVKTGSADWRNYKKSGYSRGHLLPAGDRKFSKEAYEDTFLTSNISPQKEDFNGGVWNRLEQKTRYWAEKYDELYVITGGVLTEGLTTIGEEKVAVPDYFYKILLDYTQPEVKAIAFLIPHQESNLPLYKFVTSIDEIESLTTHRFFSSITR